MRCGLGWRREPEARYTVFLQKPGLTAKPAKGLEVRRKVRWTPSAQCAGATATQGWASQSGEYIRPYIFDSAAVPDAALAPPSMES